VLAGWTTTEAGRQPWIVYGHLRTADAVAPVTAHAVALSLAGFFVIYAIILLVFAWFAGRIVLAGPASRQTALTKYIRPSLALSAPGLVAGATSDTSPDTSSMNGRVMP